MAFSLYSLIQAAILCVNAVAVLHEERFLSKSKYVWNDTRWQLLLEVGIQLANDKQLATKQEMYK